MSLVFRRMLAILLLCLMSGCAGTPVVDQQAGLDLSRFAEPPTKEELPPDAGLWQHGQNTSLFSDFRARNVGDIVRIKIVETAKASKEAKTSTARDSKVDLGINNFFGYENWLKDHWNESYGFDPDHMIRAHTINDFDGSGSTTRNETMVASISAKVVKVMANGNMIIRGSRQIRVNNEDQIIVLSGMVRPEDITVDNTVLSSLIADARIEYYGKGVVSEKQRPGWLARVLDIVWPF
ncbi:MAG: flagellar basal body L-ring protein FlgH [Deltaproteobacteria bacterium]|nr:flagellar basal body L-ring protein FlgH [Deltaproteobacteria bacterium]MBW2069702.1 flagellar basal body L-ring protein FlgH [Deltaproteobacteria bacterium]